MTRRKARKTMNKNTIIIRGYEIHLTASGRASYAARKDGTVLDPYHKRKIRGSNHHSFTPAEGLTPKQLESALQRGTVIMVDYESLPLWDLTE